MQRRFDFSIGEYYHIYNRGTDKRTIFLNSYDYNRFIVLLYLCNSTKPVDISNLIREGLSFTDLLGIKIEERLVDVGAYCLMPNHFHLLVRENRENGISLFMKKLLTAYSMYFNKKNDRKGRLFEGSFSAKHADTDEYLKYLFSYIHLNPIKLIDSEWKENGIKDRVGAKKYLDGYFYSSYLDYFGINRKESEILTPEVFPEYFSEFSDFEYFIDEWLSFKAKDELE